MLQKQPWGLIYVIMDNAIYHRSLVIQQFVENNNRICLLFSRMKPWKNNKTSKIHIII